jgi:TolB protein
MRPNGTDLQVVYSSAERKSHARYSPDGQHIVFTSGDQNDATTWEILRYNLADGSVTPLTNNETRDASPLYSPDGKTILYITTVRDGGQAIAAMDADGQNPRVLYNSPGADWAASYSPDGRFIAFSSNMSGGDRVFLMTADGQNVQQVTSNEGTYPSWMPGL